MGLPMELFQEMISTTVCFLILKIMIQHLAMFHPILQPWIITLPVLLEKFQNKTMIPTP